MHILSGYWLFQPSISDKKLEEFRKASGIFNVPKFLSLSFDVCFSFTLELHSTLNAGKGNKKCPFILTRKMWRKETEKRQSIFSLELLLFNVFLSDDNFEYSTVWKTALLIALLIHYILQIHLHSHHLSLAVVWIDLTFPANKVSHSSLVPLCSFQAIQHALKHCLLKL